MWGFLCFQVGEASDTMFNKEARMDVGFLCFQVGEASDTMFNKGASMDVGFLEARHAFTPDCYIFHDVDMNPIDDRHFYRCDYKNPMHLGVNIDRYKFK